MLYRAPVEIDHHVQLPATIAEVPVAQLPPAVLGYIYPSRYCHGDPDGFRALRHRPRRRRRRFATIFGGVQTAAPVITTRPVAGADGRVVAPYHRVQALSTDG